MCLWRPLGLSRSSSAANKPLVYKIHKANAPAGPRQLAVRASEQDPTTSLTGFVAFQPFDELQGELEAVVQSSEASNGRASLARSDYAEELEAAVNAQIK